MAGTENITLDAIATDPGRASKLAPEARAMLIVRAASVIATLSAITITTPSAPAEGPRLLKVREVAARLRCSRGHVYEMIKRGELPAIHSGRTRVVRADAIDDYLHQHEGGGN